MISTFENKQKMLLNSVATCVLAAMLYVPSANAIVPNDNTDSEEIVDEEGGVNGIGQFFRNDGFVCTGSLINPRTVLFAAHCVNDRPESDYGPIIQSAFSFDVNALPGFIDWISNGFASNPDLNVFNVNQIFYNPDSIARPEGLGFLEGDIALASLDAPAAQIPTWALLFSALPAPEALTTASGTGYHVNISGYGATGNATEGSVLGVDFRRRAAENYLGALTSLNERNDFLFGAPFGDLPQNLYALDFDDPNRSAPFDFNLYLDDGLPNEGTTAGGDSGGPLILDAANNNITDIDIVIGVLSGGSRFFGPQPFSAYGTSSFYQPLFAFYEYIAEVNPYRYVGAQAGDGDWEDASHWVTNLDPNYYVFDDNGDLVNGFPDTPEEGINSTDGDFGAVCFQSPAGESAPGDCRDLSTGSDFSSGDLSGETDSALGTLSGEALEALGLTGGEETSTPANVSGGPLSQIGSAIEGADNQSQNTRVEFAENSPQNTASGPLSEVLPDPTLDNGLAGATGFVPDNIDPDIAAGIDARYFDVTLSADGTTTLSSAVTIDRLTLNGAGAGLNVASTGSLTSLIDVEQVSGSVNVDGTLASAGDYLLMSGLLSGSGTVQTPFLTNVLGAIAPGNIGTVGTLTIDGSAVLSSASSLMIDIGANGVSDVLAITGDTSLGGQVIFNSTADVRAGNSYTFLTTGGAQTGEFTGGQVSAILQPIFTVNANSVTATIAAGNYQDVISSQSPTQVAFAELLDESRGSSASLAPVFASLDLASVDQIQAVLDSWAPVAETTTQSLAKASTDGLSNFHRQRMNNFTSKDWGGTVTVMGNPILMASNADDLSALSGSAQLEASSNQTVRRTANIPSDYAIFLSGSFLDGEGAAAPINQGLGDEDFDGWSITGGIERYVSEKISVGASLSYTQLDAEASLGQVVDSDYFAATLYGQLRSSSKVVLDGQVSLGSYGSETTRAVAVPGVGVNTLTSDDNSLAFSAELLASRPIELSQFTVAPRVGLRTTVIDFDNVQESGGIPALDINRDQYQSTQGRVGLNVTSNAKSNVLVRLTGDLVQEFGSRDGSFTASFAGVPAGGASFLLFGTDKTWAEVGASLGFNMNHQTRFDISADTTLGRSDIDAQTYRASITYKF